MNNEVKVYTPEIVADSAFPTTGEMAFQDSSGQSTRIAQDTFGAKETAEKGFPLKMVAKELLSTAINTMTQKIVKTFEFVKQGAIQIGEYINGVSGDIRISPDGITARNKSGITTFSIDGDTGDAIFSGDVRAATFTSDYFNVDNKGNVVAQSIKLASSVTAQDESVWGQEGFYNTFSTEGDHVISGVSAEIDLIKESIVVIFFSCQVAVLGNFYVQDNPTDMGINNRIKVYDTYNGDKKQILEIRADTSSLWCWFGDSLPNPTFDFEFLIISGPINVAQTYSNLALKNLSQGKHSFSVELTCEKWGDGSNDFQTNIIMPSLQVFTIGTV